MAIITPDAIVQKDFDASKGAKGYDMDQVDEFLDAVANSSAELLTQNQQLRLQLGNVENRVAELARGDAAGIQAELDAARSEAESLRAQLAERPVDLGNDAEQATAIIVMAQRAADDYQRTSKETSDQLVAEAKSEAARIVTEAEETSHRTLTQLEADRALLERKIDELRLFERDYRMRLRSYLQNLLEDLDKKGEGVPPTNPQI
jgi:DivIVA domain-containing protein